MVFEIKDKNGLKIWASKDGMVKMAMNFLKEKGCEIKSEKEIPFVDDFLFSEDMVFKDSEIKKYTDD